MIVVQTKLYSFRFDCKIVSFTAANTNLIFSVSKKRIIHISLPANEHVILSSTDKALTLHVSDMQHAKATDISHAESFVIKC